MSGTTFLNLADTASPLAQTFRIISSQGAMLTGVGLWFQSKPASGDIPVTVSIRPVTDDGFPSSRLVFPGTLVSKTPSEINTVSEFDGSTNEVKFTFTEPLYVPENTELALVVSTNANPGDYKIWLAEMGEYQYGSTTKRISSQPEVGSYFSSSNNTTWTPEQTKDLSFKLYRAYFPNNTATAKLYADQPPAVNLSPDITLTDPLKFTAGDSTVSVKHPNPHGFLFGDRVRITGLDSNATYGGIKGSSMMGLRDIIAYDPWGYQFLADSAADSDVNAGGDQLFATEQRVLDAIGMVIPGYKPPGANISITGDLTTHKSFAGQQSEYSTFTDVPLKEGYNTFFRIPFVVTTKENEITRLSGNPSTSFKYNFTHDYNNVAPFFDLTMARIETRSAFIDASDSASGISKFLRNKLVTRDYVSEVEAEGGTNAAKYLTKPVVLSRGSTAASLKVIVDAHRFPENQFTVWYRTSLSGDEAENIREKNWTAFSKSSKTPNSSNYFENPADVDYKTFREYRFSAFDIEEFNEYQIKITMASTSSSRVPRFRNLRTIATV